MIGFDSIKSNLLNNYHQHKLHHAILFHGKKGIGKASFAREFALEILRANTTSSQGKNQFSQENFIGNTFLAKANHPDLFLIEKQENKRDIVVDQIRKIADFSNQTSAISKNKFIIIDAADELNRAASNALLKILEEPHPNNFLILISHNPSKLLATVKSRCHLIKIADLSNEDFTKILQKSLFKFTAQEIKIMSIMCDNSPAKAIDVGRDMIEIYELFLNSIKNNIISEELVKKIADKNFNFEIFSEVVMFFLHRLSGYNGGQIEYFLFSEKEVFAMLNQKFDIEKIFNLSDEMAKELAQMAFLNLDKKLLLVNLFNIFSL